MNYLKYNKYGGHLKNFSYMFAILFFTTTVTGINGGIL